MLSSELVGSLVYKEEHFMNQREIKKEIEKIPYSRMYLFVWQNW